MVNFIDWVNESPEHAFIYLTGICTIIPLITTLIEKFFSTRFGKISKLEKQIKKLKNENESLNSKLSEFYDIEKIEKQITSASDGDYLLWKEKNLKICPSCWYHDKRISPIQANPADGTYTCSKCEYSGILNKETYNMIVNYLWMLMATNQHK